MKIVPYFSCASHLLPAFNDARRVVKAVVDEIMKSKLEFDVITCRGVSGLLIAPTVAMVLNKPLVVIRSEIVSNIHYRKVEGYTGIRKYIIVDDLVETGRTVDVIKKEVIAFSGNKKAKLVGIFCYNQSVCWCASDKLRGLITDCNFAGIVDEKPPVKIALIDEKSSCTLKPV